MKGIFVGFLAAATAFLIGTSIQGAVQFLEDFVDKSKAEIVSVNPVEDKPLFDLPVEDLAERKFYPFEGYYIPVKIKYSRSETYISLWIEKKNGKENFDVHVSTKSAYYTAIRVKFDEKNFSFTTEKFKGVEYRFEGTFLRNPYSESFSDFYETPVLKGTLQKFRRGKKVLEIKTGFTYTEGC